MATKFEKQVQAVIADFGKSQKEAAKTLSMAQERGNAKQIAKAESLVNQLKDIQPMLDILARATKGSGTYTGPITQAAADVMNQARAEGTYGGAGYQPPIVYAREASVKGFENNQSDSYYTSTSGTGTSNTGKNYINGKLASASEWSDFLKGSQDTGLGGDGITPGGVSGLGSVSGNIVGGGMVTQADVQTAVATALAQQQAKFDALMAQQAATKEAEKIATRTRAKDKLTSMLASFKLEGLAGWLDKQIMDDVSEEMIFLNLYDQPEYQTRFPGMKSLRAAGRTITEDEYTRIENAMMQTARFFDLPKGFYDGPEDFGNLIGKQVSAKEYQDRLQVGQDLARSLNPEVKQQLLDLYSVGEGDLTAYVLDPDRALSLIQKQAKAATFVGLGRAFGFKMPEITAARAESIVGTESYAKLTEAQMKAKLGQAGELRKEQQRLSQIEGMTYNEQEALSAVIEGNPEAVLASQQRAQREVARFRTRGGISGQSLGASTLI